MFVSHLYIFFGEMSSSLVHFFIQFSSVSQSCPTLCKPMNCSTPGLPVHHQQPQSTQIHVIESVMPPNHLILCHSILLPSIFPSIRVFSNESALRIRWTQYWSFSFNISPSNEHPGLISFRMDWVGLLAVLLSSQRPGHFLSGACRKGVSPSALCIGQGCATG